MGVPGSRAWQTSGGDEYTLVDSFTLADDLTFERTNPGSVFSCFAMGRENARQMRHCISADMWRALNLEYLRIQQVNILDIWTISPEAFYADTASAIDTFMGIAAATMYRDEGWHFMQLRRFVERAQLAVALFLSQIELFSLSYSQALEGSESDWVDLLVMDPLLPDSLCRSLDVASTELASIAPGPDLDADATARRLAGQLAAMARYQWPDTTDRERLLLLLADHCRELHSRVSTAYFDYALPGASAH